MYLGPNQAFSLYKYRPRIGALCPPALTLEKGLIMYGSSLLSLVLLFGVSTDYGLNFFS